MFKLSESLFERSQALIPGGVNSPVRAFRAVGGTPIFFREGEGAWLTDVDGNRYVDYVGSWGPMIVGHAHPEVIAAVETTARRSLSTPVCWKTKRSCMAMLSLSTPVTSETLTTLRAPPRSRLACTTI